MNLQRKYIHFVLIKDTGKTMLFEVRNNRTEYTLGELKWYPAWRQYCFFPMRDTVFNRDCLDDISDFIGELIHDRYKRRRKEKKNLKREDVFDRYGNKLSIGDTVETKDGEFTITGFVKIAGQAIVVTDGGEYHKDLVIKEPNLGPDEEYYRFEEQLQTGTSMMAEMIRYAIENPHSFTRRFDDENANWIVDKFKKLTNFKKRPGVKKKDARI